MGTATAARPGPPQIVTTASELVCTHSGQVSVSPLSQRVFVQGAPVIALGDLLTVKGCPFALGPSPLPCVVGQVVAASPRVTVDGRPVVTTMSTMMTTASGPPVPIFVRQTQGRVVLDR